MVDFEKERNGYELDIRHGGKSIEIRFDSSYNWCRLQPTAREKFLPTSLLLSTPHIPER